MEWWGQSHLGCGACNETMGLFRRLLQTRNPWSRTEHWTLTPPCEDTWSQIRCANLPSHLVLPAPSLFLYLWVGWWNKEHSKNDLINRYPGHDCYCFYEHPIHSLKRFVCVCVKSTHLCARSRACQHISYPGPGVCLWVCVQETVCVGMFMCIFGCICVPRGCNSAQDSFIKYATASEVAVNQFYLLCAGGQLSWHPWTLTPQERTGWILLLQLCFEDWSWEDCLDCYWPDVPEEKKFL